MELTKNLKKRWMEKLLKGMGHPKKGRFCRKGGMLLNWVFFYSWSVANVTTVTFNYILVAVFLFPLNVGVSPCFHCTGEGEGLHVPQDRGDEKRKGGELIHLSALCFVIVIFYVFGSKINLY